MGNKRIEMMNSVDSKCIHAKCAVVSPPKELLQRKNSVADGTAQSFGIFHMNIHRCLNPSIVCYVVDPQVVVVKWKKSGITAGDNNVSMTISKSFSIFSVCEGIKMLSFQSNSTELAI